MTEHAVFSLQVTKLSLRRTSFSLTGRKGWPVFRIRGNMKWQIAFSAKKTWRFFRHSDSSFGETWTRFKVCTDGSFAAVPQNLLDWTVLPFSHYTIKAQRMQQVSLYIKLSRMGANRTVFSLNLRKKIAICLFFYRKNQIIYRIIGFR